MIPGKGLSNLFKQATEALTQETMQKTQPKIEPLQVQVETLQKNLTSPSEKPLDPMKHPSFAKNIRNITKRMTNERRHKDEINNAIFDYAYGYAEVNPNVQFRDLLESGVGIANTIRANQARAMSEMPQETLDLLKKSQDEYNAMARQLAYDKQAVENPEAFIPVNPGKLLKQLSQIDFMQKTKRELDAMDPYLMSVFSKDPETAGRMLTRKLEDFEAKKLAEQRLKFLEGKALAYRADAENMNVLSDLLNIKPSKNLNNKNSNLAQLAPARLAIQHFKLKSTPTNLNKATPLELKELIDKLDTVTGKINKDLDLTKHFTSGQLDSLHKIRRKVYKYLKGVDQVKGVSEKPLAKPKKSWRQKKADAKFVSDIAKGYRPELGHNTSESLQRTYTPAGEFTELDSLVIKDTPVILTGDEITRFAGETRLAALPDKRKQYLDYILDKRVEHNPTGINTRVGELIDKRKFEFKPATQNTVAKIEPKEDLPWWDDLDINSTDYNGIEGIYEDKLFNAKEQLLNAMKPEEVEHVMHIVNHINKINNMVAVGEFDKAVLAQDLSPNGLDNLPYDLNNVFKNLKIEDGVAEAALNFFVPVVDHQLPLKLAKIQAVSPNFIITNNSKIQSASRSLHSLIDKFNPKGETLDAKILDLPRAIQDSKVFNKYQYLDEYQSNMYEFEEYLGRLHGRVELLTQTSKDDVERLDSLIDNGSLAYSDNMVPNAPKPSLLETLQFKSQKDEPSSQQDWLVDSVEKEFARQDEITYGGRNLLLGMEDEMLQDAEAEFVKHMSPQAQPGIEDFYEFQKNVIGLKNKTKQMVNLLKPTQSDIDDIVNMHRVLFGAPVRNRKGELTYPMKYAKRNTLEYVKYTDDLDYDQKYDFYLNELDYLYMIRDRFNILQHKPTTSQNTIDYTLGMVKSEIDYMVKSVESDLHFLSYKYFTEVVLPSNEERMLRQGQIVDSTSLDSIRGKGDYEFSQYTSTENINKVSEIISALEARTDMSDIDKIRFLDNLKVNGIVKSRTESYLTDLITDKVSQTHKPSYPVKTKEDIQQNRKVSAANKNLRTQVMSAIEKGELKAQKVNEQYLNPELLISMKGINLTPFDFEANKLILNYRAKLLGDNSLSLFNQFNKNAPAEGAASISHQAFETQYNQSFNNIYGKLTQGLSNAIEKIGLQSLDHARKLYNKINYLSNKTDRTPHDNYELQQFVNFYNELTTFFGGSAFDSLIERVMLDQSFLKNLINPKINKRSWLTNDKELAKIFEELYPTKLIEKPDTMPDIKTTELNRLSLKDFEQFTDTSVPKQKAPIKEDFINEFTQVKKEPAKKEPQLDINAINDELAMAATKQEPVEDFVTQSVPKETPKETKKEIPQGEAGIKDVLEGLGQNIAKKFTKGGTTKGWLSQMRDDVIKLRDDMFKAKEDLDNASMDKIGEKAYQDLASKFFRLHKQYKELKEKYEAAVSEANRALNR